MKWMLFLALLAVAFPAAANDLPLGMSDDARWPELLQETNEARAGAGVPPVAPLARLDGAAQLHADDMAREGFFSHTNPNPGRATVTDRLRLAGSPLVKVGENLALLGHPQDVAAEATNGWLNSPPHRRTLLNSAYTHVGFGVSHGGDGEVLVAQVFARHPGEMRMRSPAANEQIVDLEIYSEHRVTVRLRSSLGNRNQTIAAGFSRIPIVVSRYGTLEAELFVLTQNGFERAITLRIDPHRGLRDMNRLGDYDIRINGIRQGEGSLVRFESEAGKRLAVWTDERDELLPAWQDPRSPTTWRVYLPEDARSIYAGELDEGRVEALLAYHDDGRGGWTPGFAP